MTTEEILGALERAIAELVTQFGQRPDAFRGRADLCAALYHLLQSRTALTALERTRDGHRTCLLHMQQPVLRTVEKAASRNRHESYDLAILNPVYVHESPLAALGSAAPGSTETGAPTTEGPPPLLAAVELWLLETLAPAALAALEASFFKLVRAEAEAVQSYLIVLVRQWQVDAPALQTLEHLEQWCGRHRNISTVYAQAYYDDLGRVFGGRYLNLWFHTAPLPPLDQIAPRRTA